MHLMPFNTHTHKQMWKVNVELITSSEKTLAYLGKITSDNKNDMIEDTGNLIEHV